MTRLLLLSLSAALLLGSLPASAEEPARDGAAAAQEREALAVLARAVRAASSVDYRGTQYVVSWQGDATDAALVDVSHRPGRAAVVRAADGLRGPEPREAGRLSATAVLDARRVRVLAEVYDLAVAGTGRCTGREASVVEARRGDGQVAGRFWIDRDSGLLLRREVHDESGRRIRSSAFVELDLHAADLHAAAAPGEVAPGEPATTRAREQPVAGAAARLRALGWRVPDELPGGFQLLTARLSAPAEQAVPRPDRPDRAPSGDAQPHDVVHLAYTDGLSTSSLFVQRGELGTALPEGFRADTVDGRPVWVRHAAPERVVWSGGGQVWTLVSDAPAQAVHEAVAGLPRDPAPDDGLRARLGRGLARLAAALDPRD